MVKQLAGVLQALGRVGLLQRCQQRPTSRRSASESAPMPRATRRGAEQVDQAPEFCNPWGCVNSTAGPPARSSLSPIAVISSLGDTGSASLRSSPALKLGHEVAQVSVLHTSGIKNDFYILDRL
jgi:hypothetical protein